MTGPRTSSAYQRFIVRVKQLERAWVCFRCEQPIDPDVEHPDPMSWSLEHIKPVDQFPELMLDIDNAAGSHLTCNSRAGRAMQDRKTSRRW